MEKEFCRGWLVYWIHSKGVMCSISHWFCLFTFRRCVFTYCLSVNTTFIWMTLGPYYFTVHHFITSTCQKFTFTSFGFEITRVNRFSWRRQYDKSDKPPTHSIYKELLVWFWRIFFNIPWEMTFLLLLRLTQLTTMCLKAEFKFLKTLYSVG